MRHKIFQWLANLIVNHNGKMLILSALLTLIMLGAASNLKMKTRISDMLPDGIAQVEEYEKVITDFTSSSTIMITVSDEKGKNKKRMAELAEDLADSIRPQIYLTPSKEATSAEKFSFALEKGNYFEKMPFLRKLRRDVPLDTIPLIDRIDLTMDREFIEKHGFMLQKNKDLKNSILMFNDLTLPELISNINDNFEQEYTGNEENMASLDGEANAVAGIDGIYKLVKSLDSYLENGDSAQAAAAASDFITGENYFYSSDNTTLIFMVQPTVTMDNFEEAVQLTKQLKHLILRYRELYPDFQFGYSGALMLQQDETDALATDFGWPSLISIILIVLLLAGSFRTWKTPFLSVATLITAIIWVAGALGIILEFLNMMSASFGIILIGLGIDFGIHFISGFRDGRELGLGVKESIEYMYDRTATGVITGGLTTAIVFFSLSFTGFAAFTELGIAVGTGIVVTLLAMMTLLPALICFTAKFEKEKAPKEKKAHSKPLNAVLSFMEFRFIAKGVHYVQNPKVAGVIVLLAVLWAGISAHFAGKIGFEYDMMKLEPVGIVSGITQDSIISKFEMSPDFAMYLADDLEESREIVRKVKKYGERTGLVGRVDGITEMLPSEKEQNRNAPMITAFSEHIRSSEPSAQFTAEDQERLASELQRLHFNLVEMGELQISAGKEHGKIVRKVDQIVGTSDEESKILAIMEKVTALTSLEQPAQFQMITGEVLREKLLTMANPQLLTVEDLPKSIRDRYISKAGQNLVTIYPKANIWDEATIKRFNETMESRISEKVTGMPAVMEIYINLTKEKGTVAVIIGAIAIFLFLIIDFRSVKDTILAMIPLVLGTLWMVGFMYLFGVKFNMVNFMALPLIIGIGIDDGVHILHRYNIEGRMSLEEVMRFTGRAILLTSLTTCIGFGSMGLASHRGIASMGQVLVFGVMSCFITSSFVLTSLITLKKAIFNRKDTSL